MWTRLLMQSRAGGTDEISGHLVGLPIVSRVYLGYFAVLANQHRNQTVDDLAVLLVIRKAKEVSHLAYLLRRARGELPMREPGIDAANVALAVVTHRCRLVMLGVDADAEQLCLAEYPGSLLQLLHYLRKVIAHPRAIVGKRAAAIDERQQQRLAAKLVKLDRLAILVDQREIGHFVARLRDAQRRSPVALRFAAPGKSNVLQLSVVAKNQGGVDLVARRDGLENPNVLVAHRKRHGHAFHQAGDVLMGNRELASTRVNRHNAALQLVTFGGRWMRAGGNRDDNQQSGNGFVRNDHRNFSLKPSPISASS